MITIAVLITLLLTYITYKGYKWQHIISPARWKLFIAWQLKRLLNLLGEKPGLQNKYDILNLSYRASKCGDCLMDGKCLHCKCDAEGLFNSPAGECSLKKFGPVLSNEQWDTVLETTNIEINFKTSKKTKDV